jgi:hypothetical protein
VKEDGYFFLIKCLGNGTYKIDAIPDRIKATARATYVRMTRKRSP